MRDELKVGAYAFVGSADPDRNLAAMVRGLQQAVRNNVRLVLFPECALTGHAPTDFTDPRQLGEARIAAVTKAFCRCVRDAGCWAVTGTTTRVASHTFNSLILVGPDGRVRGRYHKRILFATEAGRYDPGTGDRLFLVDGWRLLPRICYEFRFPELFRPILSRHADAVLIAFSMVGRDAAKLAVATAILQARASENSVYILTANNLHGMQNAPTAFIDPDGHVVARASSQREGLVSGVIKRARSELSSQIIKSVQRYMRGRRQGEPRIRIRSSRPGTATSGSVKLTVCKG
ncbi:MAG: hypothetical protein A2498_11810 [Lentisphaerae bacterium RIFOXYC12_FULL_60_16]|nr:MAG: hypothetical protein A2498_11810 [Lentisphaerae bacterium RIFOXYC12_FULL_60_16]